ncbi:hypothetical protein XENORESO_016476 [Xenotaenia resolanae]|uniref:Uncharacterized protein n=1 Tax=Xenotaenia resolanae TaxID=208358 RepID=A0ABV0WRF0_9TELE
MGERRGHPGQVASPSQGNTQTTKHTFIHTPKGNLERPINLTGMSLDCGRKPEYPVRTHACTGRTCKLHAERPPAIADELQSECLLFPHPVLFMSLLCCLG